MFLTVLRLDSWLHGFVTLGCRWRAFWRFFSLAAVAGYYSRLARSVFGEPAEEEQLTAEDLSCHVSLTGLKEKRKRLRVPGKEGWG